MKKTLILSKDSCNYYYMVLENGEQTSNGTKDWCEYEHDTDSLIKDLQEEYGIFNFIYWI